MALDANKMNPKTYRTELQTDAQGAEPKQIKTEAEAKDGGFFSGCTVKLVGLAARQNLIRLHAVCLNWIPDNSRWRVEILDGAARGSQVNANVQNLSLHHPVKAENKESAADGGKAVCAHRFCDCEVFSVCRECAQPLCALATCRSCQAMKP